MESQESECDRQQLAGPSPPTHAAKMTAQSINDAMASAFSKRVISSAAMIARATDKIGRRIVINLGRPSPASSEIRFYHSGCSSRSR